ncbi:type III toxin-antitoxin system ToxN/AbiQ family toxin [uncultured Ruminococcus sp.]|uniref:type III toxin-antitoxin system ToxN/AbiQ family toxin n=1 Tax=uncultured Ruminococcus sp. TaxID=165186 RepID=UPI0025CCB164|nr:type III toxin-antitoxin system ToxN/AbiQ family toxin [uncultured Ruminococcus sp.]
MKQQRFKLYTLDMKYVRNLAKADNNVMSVSPQTEKSSRPFIGVLILLNGKKYCIPLSSPKKKFEGKKNSVDFIKITHSNEKDNKKIIGALNINNMLPIDDALITPIDLKIHNNDSPKSVAYKELMKDQLDFCRHNQDIILKRANKLYDIVVNHPEKNINLVKRCCDFTKLEIILQKYIEKLK